MMEFIIGAVCGIFGFMLLMEWLASKHDKIQTSNREELQDIVGDVIRENTIMMKVEFIKERKIYFCYDSTTNDYVCQGRNLKEIQRAFNIRYPSKLGHILSKYNQLFPKKDWVDQKGWPGRNEYKHLEDSKGSKYLNALEDVLKEVTLKDPPKKRAKKKKKNDK